MRLEGYYPREYKYKGFELEEACLGHKIDWEKIAKDKGLSLPSSRREWVKFIVENYPLDPRLPKKKWGKDLFDFVADKLKLDIEEPKELKFFSSHGTALDKMGIDCFFAFKNPKTEKEAICTIDLTTNPKKEEWKADLIVGETPDYRSNPEDYVQEMDIIAEEVAQKLKGKTELIH